MGLEPMGYTAANRRTIKLMVEQAAPLFEDGSAPMFMVMADAIAAVAVGKLFYAIAPIGDPNAGKKRLFLRINSAPYYEDQGDAAAPGSQAQIDASAALNQAAVGAIEARQDDVEATLSGALSSSSYRPTPADGADLPIDTYFLAPNASDDDAVWVYQRIATAPGYVAVSKQAVKADNVTDTSTKVMMTVDERADIVASKTTIGGLTQAIGLAAVAETVGTVSINSGDGAVSETQRGSSVASTVSGRLKVARACIRSGAAVIVRFIVPDGSGGYIVAAKAVMPTNPGNTGQITEWTPGVDGFPEIDLPAGSYMTLQTVADTTGRVAYASGGEAGISRVWSGDNVGDTAAVTSTGNLIIMAHFEVEGFESALQGQLEDLSGENAAEKARAVNVETRIRAHMGVDTSSVIDAMSGVAAPVNGTTPSATFRGPGVPTSSPGYLKSVSAYMRNGPDTTIRIYRPDGNGGYVLLLSGVVPCTVGLNTWSVADGDLPDIFLPAGSYVAIGPGTSGTTGLAAYGAYVDTLTYIWSGDIVGGAATYTTSSTAIQINMVVLTSAEPLQSQIDTIKKQVPAYSPSIMSFGPMPQEPFTRFPGNAVPAGWTLNGWTVDNGLVRPASFGLDKPALSKPYSFASRRIARARFRLLDANSRFGICFDPTGSGTTTYGTVALVNGASGLLELYPWPGAGSALGTPGKTSAIGFLLVPGRDYVLEVRKQRMKITLVLYDTLTGAEATIEGGPGFGALAGRAWGRAGVVLLSGDVKLLDFSVEVPVPAAPHAIILGDSNTEGSAISNNYASAWGYLLEDARADNRVLVAARGGATSSNLLNHLAADLLPYRPRYVVVSIGTNDSALSSWRTSVASIVAAIVATGAIPVLCTLVPRTGDEAKTSAINSDIRSGYFGPWPFIDFSLSVSNNGDMTTWDPAYDNGDGLHANVAGQARMFQQVQIDAPFLLDK